MKVAIWGSYEYGNYGDDLMAVIYGITALHFTENVKVYRLDKKIAEAFRLESTNDLTQLLSNNPLLIVGGGGMLIDIPLLKWLSPRLRNFEVDYLRLNNALKKNSVLDVLALSIGGSGLGIKTTMGTWRKGFYSNIVSKITLRNIEDEALLNKIGASFKTIPDVVLSTNIFFPVPVNKSDTKVIGINLDRKNKNEIDHIRRTVPEDYMIKYFKTHLSSEISGYEYVPDDLKPNEKIVQYSDLKSFVHEIATMDILFTSKLHVGVTALSYNIPFISIAAKDKTRSFLRSINSDAAYRTKVHDSLEMYLKKGKVSVKALFDWETVSVHRKQSFEHIEILKNAIQSKNSSSS